MNQAEKLLQFNQQWSRRLPRLKTVAITSGKGGVGKTNVVLNLGVALAQKKVRVGILDADFGLGNIDILLGLEPGLDINDLLNERATLEEIMIERNGLLIIPATSGVQSLTHLSSRQENVLFRELKKLENLVDLLIIDTAAGISDNVISLLLSSDEVFLIISPEPTSIVDAYAVVKVVSELDGLKPFSVITNSVQDEEESGEVFLKISRAAQKFLNKSLDYLGFIQYDRNLTEAVRLQEPVVERFPETRCTQDFHQLARAIRNRIHRKVRREAGEN
jgi:flagellar biosynthesis protein FlhG